MLLGFPVGSVECGLWHTHTASDCWLYITSWWPSAMGGFGRNNEGASGICVLILGWAFMVTSLWISSWNSLLMAATSVWMARASSPWVRESNWVVACEFNSLGIRSIGVSHMYTSSLWICIFGRVPILDLISIKASNKSVFPVVMNVWGNKAWTRRRLMIEWATEMEFPTTWYARVFFKGIMVPAGKPIAASCSKGEIQRKYHESPSASACCIIFMKSPFCSNKCLAMLRGDAYLATAHGRIWDFEWTLAFNGIVSPNLPTKPQSKGQNFLSPKTSRSLGSMEMKFLSSRGIVSWMYPHLLGFMI